MQVESNWLNKKVSLYTTHSDNIGRPITYLELLRGSLDVERINKLRHLDVDDPEYKIKAARIKSSLRCFTPAALLKCKAAGKVELVERTGVMQLDFDHAAIQDYDLKELQEAIFSLPFIGYCGPSCSGKGLYALALIDQPERLEEYATHCFEIFKDYGVKPDESKGKKIENLRYVSYDPDCKLRKNPVPLRVIKFRSNQKIKGRTPLKRHPGGLSVIDSPEAIVQYQLKVLSEVQPGERWPAVQKAAFTLGGIGRPDLLEKINASILDNEAFAGQEEKYLKCASDCFSEGAQKPFITPYDSLYWARFND